MTDIEQIRAYWTRDVSCPFVWTDSESRKCLQDLLALQQRIAELEAENDRLEDKLTIQRRIAERGLAVVQRHADDHGDAGIIAESLVDVFQHMLDEISR